MSRKIYFLGMSLLGLSFMIALTPLGLAGGGKGKNTGKKELNPIETLILAGKMEAQARATKSPAALLAAGELYWSIVPNSIEELKGIEVKTESIEGEKGDPAPEEKAVKDPRDTAKELFELAQEYARPNEKAGVEELIKGIKGTLGSLRGPHSFHKNITGKSTQSMSFTFQGKAYAQIGLRCNSMIPIHIHVTGPGVNRQDYCVYGEITWIAPKQGAVQVHIRNAHKQGASYTLFVN